MKPIANPITTEPTYSDDERTFMVAMERYKRVNRRPYPTCRETLAVLHALGYRLVAEPGEMPTFKRTSSSRTA